MKLLTALILTAFLAGSCTVFKAPPESNSGASLTVSVLIDPTAADVNVSDVMNVCNEVWPCKNVSVNNWNAGKMEVRVEYDGITATSIDALCARLSSMRGVRLTTISN